MRDGAFWILLSGVLAPPFIGTTVFFHQIYLVELRGWDLSAFAASFALMSIMTIVCALISGALIDRFSSLRILPSFLLPLAASCFALGFIEAQWGAFLFMALMGVSYGFSSTLFGALWPEIYGVRHLGAVRSVVVAIMVFATAAGPGVTGALIDWGIDLPTQIIALGVYCVLICIVMTAVSRALILRMQSAAANDASRIANHV